MTRTHAKVSRSPRSNRAKSAHTPASAAAAVIDAVKLFDGRWKLEILFCLFGGQVRRYSDLQRAVEGVSQKMLAQQLRKLERAGLIERTVHAEVPPRVEYAMTAWGQSLCPALDALIKWNERRVGAP